MTGINFKVIGLIGTKFEWARFRFIDLPKREMDGLLIWPSRLVIYILAISKVIRTGNRTCDSASPLGDNATGSMIPYFTLTLSL